MLGSISKQAIFSVVVLLLVKLNRNQGWRKGTTYVNTILGYLALAFSIVRGNLELFTSLDLFGTYRNQLL